MSGGPTYGDVVRMRSDLLAWPDWQRGRLSPLATLFMPGAFLFFLAEAVIDVHDGSYPWATRTSVLAVVLLYSVSYLFALWSGPPSSHWRKAVLVAWITIFPVALAVLLSDSTDLTYATYAIVVAFVLLPPVLGLGYGVGYTVALIVATSVEHGSPDLRGSAILVIITAAMFAIRGFARSSRELSLAREEIATLAVAEERARVARDLHDVLGHSLTTITLKAGLARRIMETSSDVDRAIAEVHDVERLSRQALTEIRATVSGYRKVSLPAEIAGARAALMAAGIDADLPQAVDDVPGDLQEPFGYVVREGVTNVLRHSAATRCQIRFGASWIEVVDDGCGGLQSSDGNGGNGLVGLAERLARVGGKIDATVRSEGGFRLRADVVRR